MNIWIAFIFGLFGGLLVAGMYCLFVFSSYEKIERKIRSDD